MKHLVEPKTKTKTLSTGVKVTQKYCPKKQVIILTVEK